VRLPSATSDSEVPPWDGINVLPNHLSAPMSSGPAPQSNPGVSKSRHGNRGIAVIVIIIVAVVLVGGFALNFFLTYQKTGPGSFWTADTARVAPGSLGCAAVDREVCYSIDMGTEFTGLQLSDVHFTLTNQSSANPNGPPQTVGPGAGVSVLQSPHVIAGHWNWSAESWINGSAWSVPVGVSVGVVFDSGLLSASSLNFSTFWVWLSSPGNGASGSLL